MTLITTLEGCETNTYKKDDALQFTGVPIKLITDDSPSIFAKSVFLFDDNNYLVKTPLDTFILGYPINGHNDLKLKAINDSKIKDTLYIYDYMPHKLDTIYTLAYHLERGSCFMWDKIEKNSIKTIHMETYSYGVPLASRAGRRFYVKNKLFLTTVDLISK
jgi:hypothetical protein